MEWKQFFDKNFSRKAEIVAVTDGSVVLMATMGNVDPGVVRMAMVIIGVVGILGIICQALLDYKHPKQKPEPEIPVPPA